MEQVKESSEIGQRFARWKTQVDHARHELNDWQEKLVTRSAGLHKSGDLAEVEHFQNQIICQQEVAETLFHDLKQASKRVSSQDGAPVGEGAWEERMETFQRLFDALHTDFEGFISKIPA